MNTAGSGRWSHWVTLVGLPAYPLLKYGVAGLSSSLLVTTIPIGIAYLLGIFLYYGVARMAYDRRFYLLWSGILAAVVVGWLSVGLDQAWTMTIDLFMPVAAGLLVGRLALSGVGDRALFFAGALTTAVLALLWLTPNWQLMHGAAQAAASDMLGNEGELYETVTTLIELLPAALVMGAVTQYSIGYLGFVEQRAIEEQRPSVMKRFIHWRIPRWLTVVAIIAATLKVFTDGRPEMAANNILVALSVGYCVTGLALIGYYLKRFRVHWVWQGVFYLLLIPTGLIGYVSLAGLGLVNSIWDWRGNEIE